MRVFLKVVLRPLLGTAGEVKVAISRGTSVKNTALDVKVKCQKKGSKIDPRNTEKTAWGGSFGTSKPRPQKGHKIEPKNGNVRWGGAWENGARGGAPGR